MIQIILSLLYRFSNASGIPGPRLFAPNVIRQLDRGSGKLPIGQIQARGVARSNWLKRKKM